MFVLTKAQKGESSPQLIRVLYNCNLLLVAKEEKKKKRNKRLDTQRKRTRKSIFFFVDPLHVNYHLTAFCCRSLAITPLLYKTIEARAAYLILVSIANP